MCSLVPEGSGERTTEGGLDVVRHRKLVEKAIKRLHEGGIKVSMSIEPDEAQVHKLFYSSLLNPIFRLASKR